MSGSAAADEIANGAALIGAVAAATPGTVLRLAAAEYRLDAALSLARPITLCGPDEYWPVLRFTTPGALLSVRSDHCVLRNLALSGERHRAAPLLQVAHAGHVRLDGIALLRCQGSGIAATDCRDLRIVNLAATELAAEAAVARRCEGLTIAGVCRGAGWGHRASAIILEECRDFVVELVAEDVSGSALTISTSGGAPLEGDVVLDARDCFRALTVLGGQAPASGFTASVRADDCVDCVVLLSNMRDAQVKISRRGHTKVPLARLVGASGVRGCHISLETTRPDDPGLIEQGGGSRDNLVTRAQAVDVAPPDASLPEPALQALAALPGQGFPVYQVEGVCAVCGWHGSFRRTLRAERETLACRRCRAALRYRGQAEALLRVLGGGCPSIADLTANGALSGLTIFEPGTTGPLRPFLSRAGRYCQSFYEQGVPSGTIRNGLECQDLMATSHPDGSFDLVVTSDILEHVRRPFVAFREIRRILRPGGAHVFTVPFFPTLEHSRARVDTSTDEDRYLLPPVHHGSGAGGLSLVYTDFGRDLGSLLRQADMAVEFVRHCGRSPEEIIAVTVIALRLPEPADR